MFEGFVQHVAQLVGNDAPVAEDLPCRSNVLSLRECDKQDKEVSKLIDSLS